MHKPSRAVRGAGDERVSPLFPPIAWPSFLRLRYEAISFQESSRLPRVSPDEVASEGVDRGCSVYASSFPEQGKVYMQERSLAVKRGMTAFIRCRLPAAEYKQRHGRLHHAIQRLPPSVSSALPLPPPSPGGRPGWCRSGDATTWGRPMLLSTEFLFAFAASRVLWTSNLAVYHTVDILEPTLASTVDESPRHSRSAMACSLFTHDDVVIPQRNKIAATPNTSYKANVGDNTGSFLEVLTPMPKFRYTSLFIPWVCTVRLIPHAPGIPFSPNQ